MFLATTSTAAGAKKTRWPRWIFFIALLCFLLLNAAGLALGNLIYEESSVLHPRLYQKSLQRLQSEQEQKHWERVSLLSRFGYPLAGTYIAAAPPSRKTLIFLHGFTDSRAAGLHYLDLYRDSGFNVLLIDSRAHGESGGSSVTWGCYEKFDLDQWVDWVAERTPGGVIGVQGLSMGAATALMHAELDESRKRIAFYVADSSYSEFEPLLEAQIRQRFSQAEPLLPLLLPYANAAAYLQARFTFHQASPLQAVAHVTTPVLYIHGTADRLVPVSMALELYNATQGPRQIQLFPGAEHVAAFSKDPALYRRTIQHFIQSLELPAS